MTNNKKKDQNKKHEEDQWLKLNPAGIFTIPEEMNCLDTAQLLLMEKSFRKWVNISNRHDVQNSRKRIFLIFLLIRYTGAKLNEILSLNESEQIKLNEGFILLGKDENDPKFREIQIPDELIEEISKFLNDPAFSKCQGTLFKVDPAHVRKKFYERAEDCGFSRKLGNPNAIRKSRAIELLKENMPLPLVQEILGQSTANISAAYIDFTPEDKHRVIKHFLSKENRRKTSARNSFFGKINKIISGDIQSTIQLNSLGGLSIVSIITNASLQQLQLKTGIFITAEVKAPWVIVVPGDKKPNTSAENSLKGRICQISKGKLTTEIIIQLEDETHICSLITTESYRRLNFKENNEVWASFTAFSVILNADL